MFLDWSKFIDKQIIFDWFWEKNVSELILSNLKEWDVFLDIWANIWYFSLLWSKIVWQKWKVLSFEPSSINFNILDKNIKLNNSINIDYFKLWVWNNEQEFEIFFNNDNPWATSIVKTKENNNFQKEIIKVIKIDNFITNKKVDFIKMDIEWFEYDAFLWMKEILKINDNIKIIFEYSPKIYKEKEENHEEYSINILNELNKLNFKLFHINKDWSLLKIDNNNEYYKSVLNNNIWQSDIFCKKIK